MRRQEGFSKLIRLFFFSQTTVQQSTVQLIWRHLYYFGVQESRAQSQGPNWPLGSHEPHPKFHGSLLPRPHIFYCWLPEPSDFVILGGGWCPPHGVLQL